MNESGRSDMGGHGGRTPPCGSHRGARGGERPPPGGMNNTDTVTQTLTRNKKQLCI